MVSNNRENLDLPKNDMSVPETIGFAGNQTIGSVKETIGSQVAVIKEKANLAQQKVSENLAAAAEVVHQKSDATQEALDYKTDKINEFAHNAIEKVNEFGHRAGDALVTSSDLVRKFDLAQSASQLKVKIKENPGISLSLVGIFGLALGLMIGRSRSTE